MQEEKVATYTLRLLTGGKWESLKTAIEEEGSAAQDGQGTLVEAEETSIHDVTGKFDNADGAVLDANREVRVKLYMGQVRYIECLSLRRSEFSHQVFMGWFWFIPAFHMTNPVAPAQGETSLSLTRKEVDFPLGIGANIIEVEVGMEWCSKLDSIISPADRQGSLESQQGTGDPPALAAVIQAAASGQVSEALEAIKAGDE